MRVQIHDGANAGAAPPVECDPNFLAKGFAARQKSSQCVRHVAQFGSRGLSRVRMNCSGQLQVAGPRDRGQTTWCESLLSREVLKAQPCFPRLECTVTPTAPSGTSSARGAEWCKIMYGGRTVPPSLQEKALKADTDLRLALGRLHRSLSFLRRVAAGGPRRPLRARTRSSSRCGQALRHCGFVLRDLARMRRSRLGWRFSSSGPLQSFSRPMRAEMVTDETFFELVIVVIIFRIFSLAEIFFVD